MFTYHSEKVKSAEYMTSLVSALYSCEDSMTTSIDTKNFWFKYEYGAWNKDSAKVTNDVRKFETIVNKDTTQKSKVTMEVLIESITLEKTPKD